MWRGHSCPRTVSCRQNLAGPKTRCYDQRLGRGSIKTVNLKSDMPQVHEALTRLDRELAAARQQGEALLKLIHGHGSTGAGGDIRIAVQKRLRELSESGQIRSCIFGESWSKSDEEAWRLLQSHPALKRDTDLGRRNQGITIVVL